nr:MAG TPA: hypothetical protein [Caudoviricetes sp.]
MIASRYTLGIDRNSPDQRARPPFVALYTSARMSGDVE